MVKSFAPRFYADIGKETKDLLYKDYPSCSELTLTTDTPIGAITYTRPKVGDSFLAGLKTAHLKDNIITTDVKVDSNYRIFGDLTCKLASGLKTIFGLTSDRNSRKVEIQYQHDYAAVSTSIGLAANPIINFSGTTGSNYLSLGTDVVFDTATQSIRKCVFGLHLVVDNLIGATNLGTDTVNLSFFHLIRPLTCTAIGYEFALKPSTEMSTLTIGAQHALDPLTMVKGRVDNFGKASVIIRHEWREKCLFTIHGEVDVRAIKESTNIGLTVGLKL